MLDESTRSFGYTLSSAIDAITTSATETGLSPSLLGYVPQTPVFTWLPKCDCAICKPKTKTEPAKTPPPPQPPIVATKLAEVDSSFYYLSGPMTGIVDYNRPAFNAAAADLRSRLLNIVNPAEMDVQAYKGSADRADAEFLHRDLEYILRCGGIIALDGWQGSKGACLEIKVALMTGKTAYHYVPAAEGGSWWITPFSDDEKEILCSAEIDDFLSGITLPIDYDFYTALVADELNRLDDDEEDEDDDENEDDENEDDCAGPDAYKFPDVDEVPETSVLQIADAIIHGARNASYGPPSADMGRTGKMWAAILGLDEVTAEQVALCMIALKISRQCHKPGVDNLIDIAGYAGTIQMMEDDPDDE